MKIRVGYGFDVHQLNPDRELWLGGIKIESDLGALGHSDADVLIHAICDALLGAAALRDIGFHFPDTDARFKNADSKNLLKEVTTLLKNHAWQIGNVDATLVMERPKIKPYIESMQVTLANCMGIEPSDVSIKATTNEQLGFIGRREGVSAHAVALIQKQ